MSHVEHLFPPQEHTDANGKPVIVLMIEDTDRLYIPAALAGHYPFEAIESTLEVGEASRLTGHPASPFDATDEIILVTNDPDNEDQLREFLVDSKHIAHHRACPECKGIWAARDVAYNSLDDAEKATASFFAITETNRGPYLVYAGDLEPST